MIHPGAPLVHLAETGSAVYVHALFTPPPGSVLPALHAALHQPAPLVLLALVLVEAVDVQVTDVAVVAALVLLGRASVARFAGELVFALPACVDLRGLVIDPATSVASRMEIGIYELELRSSDRSVGVYTEANSTAGFRAQLSYSQARRFAPRCPSPRSLGV